MNVLVVEPGFLPYEQEINGLSDMEKIVGGPIEAIYPFQENVAVVTNANGANNKLEFNRSILERNETDARDYTEVVTLDGGTKDMAEIIKVLEPEREITTEDGYTGILKPDYTKTTVEAAGYKNNSWTVSASRTYPICPMPL